MRERERERERHILRVSRTGQLCVFRLSVCLSVHLYGTCCCFFVILFCSCECRSHSCFSCHVGLKPVLFATQTKIANSVCSCSSSVPSPALCVVSSDQCCGCDHVVVVCLSCVWCGIYIYTDVHIHHSFCSFSREKKNAV